MYEQTTWVTFSEHSRVCQPLCTHDFCQ